MKTDSSHLQYLITTRPQQRAESLLEKIKAQNHQAVNIPCIESHYVNKDNFVQYNQRGYQQFSQQLLQQDIIIFVSVNAVRGFFSLFSASILTRLKKSVKFFAVGSATAKELNHYGSVRVVFPQSEYNQNSEGLLAEPELQELSGKNCLIIRGDSGRKLLAVQLPKRGVRLLEGVVYTTKKPVNLRTKLSDTFKELRLVPAANIKIIFTSVRIVDNFFKSLDAMYVNKIKECQIIAPSARISEGLKKYQCNNITIAGTINEDSIADIINKIN